MKLSSRQFKIFVLTSFLTGSLTLGSAVNFASASSAKTCGWDTASGWVQRENSLRGFVGWDKGIPVEFAGDFAGKESIRKEKSAVFQRGIIPGRIITGPEGWFSSPSATCDQKVLLHISGNGLPVKISVFRLGYYAGSGARLVQQTVTKAIPHYGTIRTDKRARHTISTDWPTAWSFKVGQGMLPGQYLIRLDDGSGDSNFVPLMVINPNSRDSIAFISSILTWQAYNAWGNFSLYKGDNQTRASRAMVASFNRPYDGDGSGQFRYMEYPLIRMAEKLGLDINYITDLQLQNDKRTLHYTKSIFLGGHSEYWTTEMRNALDFAVAQGANLVSFGGNAGYNRPRLNSNNRELIMWRGATSDPNRKDPILATTRWRSAPILRPEAALLGSQYVGLGVNGDFHITRPYRWPFSVLKGHTIIKSVVGREVDSPLYSAGPAVESLASSNLLLKGKRITAIATYYNNSNFAGVIDISTNGWVCAIDNVCPWHPPQFQETSRNVQLVTREILNNLSKGAMGRWHPAMVDFAQRVGGSKRLPAPR